MIVDRNEIVITEEESKICKLDGKRFDSSRQMINYVKKTYKNINSYEDYVIAAYYDGIRPVCLKTGKELTFKPHKLGPWFKNYSKNAFPRKSHSNETKLKIKENTKKAIRERFDVDNVFETEWCKKKIKETNIKTYGVDNPMKSPEVVSNIDFSKDDHIIQKTNNTNLKRYGSKWVMGSSYFKLKTKESLLKKYNVDNISKLEDIKQRQLRSYWKTIKERGYKRNVISSDEIDFENKLKCANINYIKPFLIEERQYDFYIPDLGVVIEIDGEAYHKDILKCLTFQTINTSINDFNKDKIAKNNNFDLIRIRYNKELFSFENLHQLKNKIEQFKYNRNYSIGFKQQICEKSYLFNYKLIKGSDKLNRYVNLLHRFIKIFQPAFPEISTDENLQTVINEISTYNADNILMGNTFRNNCSLLGVSYLKSKFKSYWNTRFKQNKHTPISAWGDDELMKRIISYRIGINDSGEVFDFSLHQLIRGMSAIRLTASFFKPILAASIYKELLKDNSSPTVIDPCCGFGGRLLGFKSKYPNGKYIGCEPNTETYNELLELVDNSKFSDVEIYNCKWEDFSLPDKYDLIFTSIPYFDLEIYSKNTTYKNFSDWENVFIEKFKNLNNCYVNMDVDCCVALNLSDRVKYTIDIGKSHLSSANKHEVIIKF